MFRLGKKFFVKEPPPPSSKGKNFWHQIWLDTCSDWEKKIFVKGSPPPSKGKKFWHQIWLDTCSDRKKFFCLGTPLSSKGKNFWHQIWLDTCSDWEKIFLSRDPLPLPPWNSKKLLWPRGGRYASCVHAGGLSCSKDMYTLVFIFTIDFLYSTPKHIINKKVLLREHKSHTAHRLAALSPDLQTGGVPPSSRDMGVPHPIPTGEEVPPSSPDGAYPSSRDMGVPYPIPTGGGVPPSSPDGAYPIQSWMGVTPCILNGGYRLLICEGGIPSSWPVMGVPPVSQMGTPPPVRTGWGTPNQPDGVPSAMVDKVKTLPSVILRMRAITRDLNFKWPSSF